MTSSITQIRSLDHLVLTVQDLHRTVRFYESVLGTIHVSFRASGGEERHALVFGSQKINLHLSGHEFEPKAATVQPGSADLCFLIKDPVDEVAARLREKALNEVGEPGEGIQLVDGGNVVDRTGAKAKLRSVYLRDPDGNLIEYVKQKKRLNALRFAYLKRRIKRKEANCISPRLSNEIT